MSRANDRSVTSSRTTRGHFVTRLVPVLDTTGIASKTWSVIRSADIVSETRTIATPSNRARFSSTQRRTSIVLPIPPGPVIVTVTGRGPSGVSNSSSSVASSSVRPTKGDASETVLGEVVTGADGGPVEAMPNQPRTSAPLASR